ncbi:MAG: methyltransferase domain-containing protein [Verrucomicrobiota bacterium]
MEFSEKIQEKYEAYYKSYYDRELGLKNWKKLIEFRLQEDTTFGPRVLNWVKDWIPVQITGANILVVGGGTGAETVAFSQEGAKVTALEPSVDACEIIRDKIEFYHLKDVQVVNGIAEKMTFKTDEFDLMVCFTVLEHTQNPEACLEEMVRTLKPKGWLFLVTPDYRGVYEQHYKMLLPLFAPKWITKWILRSKGRPEEFLDTLQFVNARQLRNKFQMLSVNAMQLFHPYPENWIRQETKEIKWMMRWSKWFGIQKDQFWLVQKK